MRNILSRKYWWPKMEETIAEVLTECLQCTKLRKGKTWPRQTLYPTAKGYRPFQIWAIDLMPSLPADQDGDSVLAVAVCCFSKWVEVCKFPAKRPELIAGWFE
jgi:hypothetical protein